MLLEIFTMVNSNVHANWASDCKTSNALILRIDFTGPEQGPSLTAAEPASILITCLKHEHVGRLP